MHQHRRPLHHAKHGAARHFLLALLLTLGFAAVEAIAGGEPTTPFLKFGDRVRIEMLDAEGNSLFGAIEQQVAKYIPPK